MAVKDNDAGKTTLFEQPAINEREAKEAKAMKSLNVYQRLNKVRSELLNIEKQKSGKNTFQKYDYFELKDFIPMALKACEKWGLCGQFSWTVENGEPKKAVLFFTNVDNPNEVISFAHPAIVSTGSSNPIQNMGATDTYTRRYLWSIALELTETDQIDGQDQKAQQKNPPAPKATAEQITIIKSLYSEAELKVMCEKKRVGSIEELTTIDASKMISFRKGKENGENAN